MRRIYIIILIFVLSLSISVPFSQARSNGNAEHLIPSVSLSHVKLKGTLFTGSLNPLAVIEDTRDNKITMYEIGDTLDGGLKIAYITRGEVTFEQAGKEYNLSLPTGGVWQPQSSQEDGKWYNIKRQGNTFLVDQQTVSGGIRRVREIMRNTSLKPYFKDGKKHGVEVAKFTEVGVLKEIGVKKGDVITNINGLTLNSPYQIFKAYRTLRNQEELSVDIIRNKKPLVLTYQIAN